VHLLGASQILGLSGAERVNVQSSAQNAAKSHRPSRKTVLILTFAGEAPEFTPFLALTLGEKYAKKHSLRKELCFFALFCTTFCTFCPSYALAYFINKGTWIPGQARNDDLGDRSKYP
jgi:hypothetical protein